MMRKCKAKLVIDLNEYQPMFNIGEVAKMFGCKVEDVRSWGISSSRTVGGHRRYSRADIEKFMELINKKHKELMRVIRKVAKKNELTKDEFLKIKQLVNYGEGI